MKRPEPTFAADDRADPVKQGCCGGKAGTEPDHTCCHEAENAATAAVAPAEPAPRAGGCCCGH